MTKTVFAHTPPGSNFPPFVNLSRNDGGGYTLTVRSQGNGGSNIGSIVLSPENVEALAADALADLYREPVASVALPVVDPGPDSLERETQAKAASAVPPHQQRVLDEKRELDERLSKLDAFILDNPLYLQLPTDEQDRLSRQSKAMAAYSGILDERIASF